MMEALATGFWIAAFATASAVGWRLIRIEVVKMRKARNRVEVLSASYHALASHGVNLPPEEVWMGMDESERLAVLSVSEYRGGEAVQ